MKKQRKDEKTKKRPSFFIKRLVFYEKYAILNKWKVFSYYHLYGINKLTQGLKMGNLKKKRRKKIAKHKRKKRLKSLRHKTK